MREHILERAAIGFGIASLVALFGVSIAATTLAQRYVWSLAKVNEPVFCTQEAKQCPDGSYVGRTGKRCEFAPCQGLKVMTGADCRNAGGEVVNTLVGVPDYSPSEVLGEITEANCPCTCVKRSNNN